LSGKGAQGRVRVKVRVRVVEVRVRVRVRVFEVRVRVSVGQRGAGQGCWCDVVDVMMPFVLLTSLSCPIDTRTLFTDAAHAERVLAFTERALAAPSRL
jgi:hypothetical protein